MSYAQCSAHLHLLQLATSAHMHQQLLLKDLHPAVSQLLWFSQA